MSCLTCGYPQGDWRIATCPRCGAAFPNATRPSAPRPAPAPDDVGGGPATYPTFRPPAAAPTYGDPTYGDPGYGPRPAPAVLTGVPPGAPLRAPVPTGRRGIGRTVALVVGGLVLLAVGFSGGYVAVTRLLF